MPLTGHVFKITDPGQAFAPVVLGDRAPTSGFTAWPDVTVTVLSALGGWVYFQGTDNKLWKVFNDGSQQAQIGGNTTASTPFVTADGWVYFQGTDNKLWKVFNDGSQQAQIGGNTTASTPFVTADGWVYFQGTDNKLWKVFNDGSQQAQIGGNTTASTPFVTADGWVYFQGTDNKLWKVFNDGSQQAQIGGNTTASTPFVTADGWVYFQGTDNKLWKVFNDGSQQAQIGGNTTASTPFVTADGWVYFQGTDNKLWKVFNDGSQQAQIGGNTTASTPFVTADGWVYFQGTDNKLWKVFNDGSQQAQIGGNTTASTPFVTAYGPESSITGQDGSFSLADQPFPSVWLTVTSRVPLYRSGGIPHRQALSSELDIWLFPDTLPTSDGITAGTVSQQLSGRGFPGNTIIDSGAALTGSAGLTFAGSEGQVSLAFGINITPDLSQDLQTFLDINLNGWHINVGFPTDLGESADDVLNSIRSGLGTAATGLNATVLQQMQTILEAQEGLTASMAMTFLTQDVSVTFMDVNFPNQHSWGIGDTSDKTIVLTADPCIGFPRNLSASKAK